MTSETSGAGAIESIQRLADLAGREWGNRELLAAAERAELRNTGWPVGLVLTVPGLAPIPSEDGIEARIEHRVSGVTEDYWYLRKDGSYYVSRLFEEDFPAYRTSKVASSRGQPDKVLWFDIRIWRIAEVVLHSATLYRELGIAPDEPYLLAVNHRGLEARELSASDVSRIIRPGRICRSPDASWMNEVSVDYVTSNLKSIVGDVAGPLFELFDFASISESVIGEIVEKFLHSRV